jgi:hypothetical protein
MNSVGLQLFQDLCAVGNALEALRDLYVPESDQWLWHTEVLALVDSSIDTLVHSEGLHTDNDDLPLCGG